MNAPTIWPDLDRINVATLHYKRTNPTIQFWRDRSEWLWRMADRMADITQKIVDEEERQKAMQDMEEYQKAAQYVDDVITGELDIYWRTDDEL